MDGDGDGMATIGVRGIGVTGLAVFNGAVVDVDTPGAGIGNGGFGVPKRLAARIYCANAAFCSGVAVLLATAVNIALNSGLVAAISVKALTVRVFELEVVGVEATGAGGGGAAIFAAFSAFSSTFLTERKRVSGKICGPMTTGHIPRRVVMYCEVGGGSFLPRRVGFHTLGK
jgi:hypothetical protein